MSHGEGTKQCFQTQHSLCTYELTETVTACTRPAQVQTRQNPSMRRGSGNKLPPQSKNYLWSTPAWKKKITFLQWSATGYIKQSSRASEDGQ